MGIFAEESINLYIVFFEKRVLPPGGTFVFTTAHAVRNKKSRLIAKPGLYDVSGKPLLVVVLFLFSKQAFAYFLKQVR